MATALSEALSRPRRAPSRRPSIGLRRRPAHVVDGEEVGVAVSFGVGAPVRSPASRGRCPRARRCADVALGVEHLLRGDRGISGSIGDHARSMMLSVARSGDSPQRQTIGAVGRSVGKRVERARADLLVLRLPGDPAVLRHHRRNSASRCSRTSRRPSSASGEATAWGCGRLSPAVAVGVGVGVGVGVAAAGAAQRRPEDDHDEDDDRDDARSGCPSRACSRPSG